MCNGEMALIDSQINCEIDFKFKEQNYCRLFDQVMWKEPWGEKDKMWNEICILPGNVHINQVWGPFNVGLTN